MFTQALAREIGSRGITVNNVQPGPIDTELNPASGDWAVPQKAATALDRYGRVDEIAAMVAFVAGPESALFHSILKSMTAMVCVRLSSHAKSLK